MAVQKRSQIAFRYARKPGRAKIFDDLICGTRKRTFEAVRRGEMQQFRGGSHISFRSPIAQSRINSLASLCLCAVFAAGDRTGGFLNRVTAQFFVGRLEKRTRIQWRFGRDRSMDE